ncbi:MAG: hypothetical protein JWO98_4530 [Frankiales bacterium]|nr:hypothetical protein [Frankiales bacterium]
MTVIGTIDGTFLAPGVSANGRLYTAEVIEKAVARMQDRLADPEGFPITMLSHHAAKDDSKEICARITGVALDEATHKATWEGYLIGTRAGRDIAEATEPGPDGRRTLDSVSIRGWWLGPVRKVDVDGRTCEAADDLEIDGIDFTKTPGVSAARIASATRLATESAGDARTPITETVEVQLMPDSRLVHSTSTPSPTDVPPKPGSPVADEAKAPPFTKKKGDGTGDDKAAATDDPAADDATDDGADGDTADDSGDAAAPAAPAKKAPANKAPVKKGKKAAESAESHPLAETLAAIREAHVRVGGWQGPVDIDLDAWGLSNDDVAAAATQLGAAYVAALRVLDPDNDDDLDLPNGDEVTCPGCSAACPSGATYCPDCGELVAETAAAAEAADTEKETEVSEDKAAETAKDEAAETAPAKQTAEETATPAEETAPAMTPADHEAIASLLHSKLTTPATETAPALDADAVAEAVRKAVGETRDEVRKELADELRKEMLESYGTPRRKGLVEAVGKHDEKPLHEMSPEEFTRHAGQAWESVLGG